MRDDEINRSQFAIGIGDDGVAGQDVGHSIAFPPPGVSGDRGVTAQAFPEFLPSWLEWRDFILLAEVLLDRPRGEDLALLSLGP